MPKYDLAGNPLPDTEQPVPSIPSQAIPPRYDGQGRTLHAAPPPAASAPSPAMHYDLAGNPIPQSASPAPQPGNWSPPPTAGAWPPPPSASSGYANPYGMPQFRNTSGEQADVPPEIARLRWNWGAFCFPILWCKKHGMTTVAALLGGTLLALRWARRITFFVNPGMYLLIVVVYALIYFSIAVYFGFTGHGYGWRNRRFESVQDYLSCQTKWMWWGLAINGFLTILLPLLLVLGILGAASLSGSSNAGTGTMSHAHGDSQPVGNNNQ